MPTDYTLMDATLEILLMLLAAFLLGWLFCWLIKKLFGSKSRTISKQTLDAEETTIKRPEGTGIVSSNRERIYNADADLDHDLKLPEIEAAEINLNEVDLPTQANIETPDLGMEAPTILNPRPRIDLPDFNTPDLDTEDKLTSGKETLGKGLGLATAGIGAVAVGASSFKDKVAGKVEELSPNIDINTPEMPDLTLETPEILSKDFEVDLPELDIDANLDLDANLETGIELPEIDTNSFETEIDLPKTPEIQTTTNNLIPDNTLNPADLPVTNLSSNQEKPVTDKPVANADDLTRITGIDGQVTEALNARGIHSYQDLKASNRTQLKGHLDASNNPKLREIEPASWPHQATLCASRNWSKLTEYQSFLTGSNLGVRQTTTHEDSTGTDDLKKIEGIGPFFESLLNEAGITTYEQLKNSDRDTLKEIIDAAGPDYRMHEPETWPYQAGLAYRGEWKKLQDYIHFMTGRS